MIAASTDHRPTREDTTTHVLIPDDEDLLGPWQQAEDLLR
ncbi:hypothetical protein FHX42_001239 [Saccharopolyspora lacisalsi]|uniref:Uncharacterized protein n=1 Tax=Halosaccharopolyspora lacisalsi TaxID=1000566 RepID=A0A839DSH5_9PSEU|nr:hypothetical protein [Halosaccharopolyspora lacisalsi]